MADTRPHATVEVATDPSLGWSAQLTGGADNNDFAYDKYLGGQGHTFVGSSPAAPATPTAAQATTGGSMSDGAKGYKITYYNSRGETAASAERTISVNGGGSTQKVTLTIAAKPGWADGTNVYGRASGGPWGLIGNTATTSFIDDGTVTASVTVTAPAAANAAALINH